MDLGPLDFGPISAIYGLWMVVNVEEWLAGQHLKGRGIENIRPRGLTYLIQQSNIESEGKRSSLSTLIKNSCGLKI